MKNSLKTVVPILLALLIIASLVWYCFVYDRDFTRDMLLNQARYHSTNGNPKIASWFYDLAYEHSGQDENVAIELANQFKAEGNFTKAEYTLSNAIADGGTAELNRLTITVQVRFTNAIEPQWNYNKQFSGYRDYNASELLQQVEGSLIQEIVNDLVDDIFNACVSNW